MCIRVSVEIKLNGDKDKLRSLMVAMEPDNVNLPEGMTIEMKMESGQLIIACEGNIERIPSILNTLDEMISLAKSSLNTIGDKM
ncbi:MAG: KEOPS complex subunit Pcc1 [Nitrososphaeria archaeon]